MKNPVEAFLGTKTAGVFDSVRQKAPEMMAHAVVGGGIAAGAAGIQLAASKIYDAISKRQSFRALLESDGEMQAHHEADPRRFNQMFSSLHAANPHFTQDPIIAGTYLRKMLSEPGNAGTFAVEAGEHKTRPSPGVLGAGIEGSAQGLMSGFHGKQRE